MGKREAATWALIFFPTPKINKERELGEEEEEREVAVYVLQDENEKDCSGEEIWGRRIAEEEEHTRTSVHVGGAGIRFRSILIHCGHH